MTVSAFALDSLELAKELEASGVPRDQAVAHVHILSQVSEASVRGLATKDDVRTSEMNLRRDMEVKFAAVDAKFAAVDGKFATMEAKFEAKFVTVDAKLATMDSKLDKLLSQMTARLGGMVLAAVLALPFIFKLFHLL